MSTTDYSIGWIVSAAGCRYPESDQGIAFLRGLLESAREVIEYQPGVPLDRLNDNGAISEAADSAVPIYTWTRWRVFADVGAYNEDPTELGFEGEDMSQGAGICLYMIAERGIHAICEDILADLDDTDDDEEDEA